PEVNSSLKRDTTMAKRPPVATTEPRMSSGGRWRGVVNVVLGDWRVGTRNWRLYATPSRRAVRPMHPAHRIERRGQLVASQAQTVDELRRGSRMRSRGSSSFARLTR